MSNYHISTFFGLVFCLLETVQRMSLITVLELCEFKIVISLWSCSKAKLLVR